MASRFGGQLVLWLVLRRDTNFCSHALMYFLKFAWVAPLKNKTGESLVNFQTILDTGRSFEKLQTDKGTEIPDRNFQSFPKEKSILFFTTNCELKASVVERFNRTLKTRMWKYFTAKNTRVFIDILQDIMQGYNSSILIHIHYI